MEIIIILLIFFRVLLKMIGFIYPWNDSNEEFYDSTRELEELREFDYIPDSVNSFWDSFWNYFIPLCLRRPHPKDYRIWRDQNVITDQPKLDTAWNDFLDFIYQIIDFIFSFFGGWF